MAPIAPLHTLLAERHDALRQAAVATDHFADPDALLLASDYAFEQLCRRPDIASLPPSEPWPLPVLATDDEARWPDQLRRYRHACYVRLVARDTAPEASLEETVRESSRIADQCVQLALDAVCSALIARHGQPRNAAGEVQQLVVFALGKLGGSELNFSSDIDLVFAYPESGSSDGPRPLDNESWFIRAGQRLIQLLGDTTVEGFGFRVDMRLRPFGSVGRLALSFAAMEHYFQREGRDWERYAWIKARPIAGDLDAGERLLRTLRPFIYRRYLDFTAFEGLRQMKALIEAEVQRRDLAEDLKLGPGGIREIEFVVQLHQLIRGGREAPLRARGLLPALSALEQAGYVSEASAGELRRAYHFLRRLENRLQMLRDEQVHALPDDDDSRQRLAASLHFDGWESLYAALEVERSAVRGEFARVFEARSQAPVAEHAAFESYWRQIERGADADQLAATGMADADRVHVELKTFGSSAALRQLSARARLRLDRLLPVLLAGAAQSSDPPLTVVRLLRLLHAVLGRSSYLALLDEQPVARRRLVDVMANSAALADRLAEHPVLLDDLLDSRATHMPPDREAIRDAWQRASAGIALTDTESRLQALNELRQSLAFRVAREALFDRQSAETSSRQLAFVADVVLEALLEIAIAGLRGAHGDLPDAGVSAGIAIVGYGSLGGEELGFGSDLDLVFLFDAERGLAESDGPRPIDATRYQLRVVQKLLALLATTTPAGRLYEADLRLRPDGGKGLLLCSVRRFTDYQMAEAWPWEHQALVRARVCAGDPAVGAAFNAVRRQVLAKPRERERILPEVVAMRERLRAERDRSTALSFDLKQGLGGLVDLEFLLQGMVLTEADRYDSLLAPRHSADLLIALADSGLMHDDQCQQLRQAHALLLAAALRCTLDHRPRTVISADELKPAREAITRAWSRLMLPCAQPIAAAEPLQ